MYYGIYILRADKEDLFEENVQGIIRVQEKPPVHAYIRWKNRIMLNADNRAQDRPAKDLSRYSGIKGAKINVLRK